MNHHEKKKSQDLSSPHPVVLLLTVDTGLLTHEPAHCTPLPGVATSVKLHKPVKLVTVFMEKSYPFCPPSCTSYFVILLFR